MANIFAKWFSKKDKSQEQNVLSEPEIEKIEEVIEENEKEIEEVLEHEEEIIVAEEIEQAEEGQIDEIIEDIKELEEQFVTNVEAEKSDEQIIEQIEEVIEENEKEIEEILENEEEIIIEEEIEQQEEVKIEEIIEDIKELEKEQLETNEEVEDSSEENIEEAIDINDEEGIEEIQEINDENTDVSLQEGLPKPEGPKNFFTKLKEGLTKTRDSIKGRVNSVLANFRKIDEELFEELEEILIMADMGVATTSQIIENIKKKVKLANLQDPQEIKILLKQEINDIMTDQDSELNISTTPSVVVIVGVNGVGKTTSIGKIANVLKNSGKKVIVAAADTFRAAAIDQLEVWSHRAKVDIIKHNEGADPAAVVFDAISAAKSRKADVLICDTAGRLHNKKNLMDELGKIKRIVSRELPDAATEVLLVLDATTGQNAVMQAKTFKETVDLTGIILTKLDGTAKGGIVVSIKQELGVPVKFIGVGEGINDLQKFDANDYVEALFAE